MLEVQPVTPKATTTYCKITGWVGVLLSVGLLAVSGYFIDLIFNSSPEEKELALLFGTFLLSISLGASIISGVCSWFFLSKRNEPKSKIGIVLCSFPIYLPLLAIAWMYLDDLLSMAGFYK